MSNTITPTVFYRTLNMEGLEIFYREAGPRDAPTVLLLHGFPSSSHMFRNLIPMLADKYHVVAPDFPGYGESSAPSVNDFDYSYERLATVTEKFTEKLNLSSELSLRSPQKSPQFSCAKRAPFWDAAGNPFHRDAN